MPTQAIGPAIPTGVAGPAHAQAREVADVVVLRWPAQAAQADALAAAGVPRLLLVDPVADPPKLWDSRADWIRLPADERDVAARILGLTRRLDAVDAVDAAGAGGLGGRDEERPVVDGAGRLLFQGGWVALSPIEARLAEALTEHFNAIVPTEELWKRGWPEAGEPTSPTRSPNALRVHLTRLRRRLIDLGLEVRAVRSNGCVLQPLRVPQLST